MIILLQFNNRTDTLEEATAFLHIIRPLAQVDQPFHVIIQCSMFEKRLTISQNRKYNQIICNIDTVLVVVKSSS